MLERDGRREPAPTPIVDALLKSMGSVDAEELCELGIPTRDVNKGGSLFGIHAADLNTVFISQSNIMCNTTLNELFSVWCPHLRIASKAIERDPTIL
jgi:hypothetical protein